MTVKRGGSMEDLISREKAIDALFELYEYQRDIDPTEAADLVRQGIFLAEKKIEQLPSAQPDLPIKAKCAFCPHCNNCDVNDDLSIQPCKDAISRQAAIDAVNAVLFPRINAAKDAERALRNLQPAQPETHEERTETHACDCISRQAAIDAHYEYCNKHPDAGFPVWSLKILEDLPPSQPDLSGYSDKLWKKAYERGKAEALAQLEEAYISGETEAEARFHAQQRWIPCSERLPEDIRPVIVTWKNTDPASYYQYIVGKHFTGTACYKNGKWYWYSSTTEDMLSEYGRYDSEEFDEAIECIAWMPLPEPYAERRTDD